MIRPPHNLSNSQSTSTLLQGSNDPPNDPPKQDNNIMNIRGDLNSSLYQICLSLRRRLAQVPGFHDYLAEMDEEEAEADGATDPVTTMWNCLRRGYPLMTIYNALKPHDPLIIDANRIAERQIGKAATFKFLQACLTDLKIPANECFLITDLYGGDTTGFVKVTKVVNKVLDKLDQQGLLLPSEPGHDDYNERPAPGSKPTHVQHVVQEIVESERTYVQHLEVLQQARNELNAGGVVPGDSIHDIFLNLNALLDFQRRFLIRIEQQNSLPESQQNWGQLFIQYKDSFRVYEPFIANQTKCNDTVTREWDKISATPHSTNLNSLFENQAIFHGFCVKPFQRLSKYPLLLGQLRHKCQLEAERESDLIEGEAAANSLMGRANEAVAKEQRNAAVHELQLRVEDWKGHNIKQFGELLMYGNFTVIKGDGAKPQEREVCHFFSLLPAQARTGFLLACGQSTITKSARHSYPEAQKASDEKVPGTENHVIQPSEDHSNRRLKKVSSLYEKGSLLSAVEPALPRVDSGESSRKWSGSPSPVSSKNPPKSPTKILTRSPTLKETILRLGKRSMSQDISPLLALNAECSFNSPFVGGTKFHHVEPKDVGSSWVTARGLRSSQPSKHTSVPLSWGDECVREEQLVNPVCQQYIIYLFERILLCCKEVNPNKQRPKMLRNERAPANPFGKVRLQLKGRIFMQNVTDVLSFVRTGNTIAQTASPSGLTRPTEKSSYTIQIFWKGDPGVENFIIRFSNEAEMNKWRDQVQFQKQSLSASARSSGQTGTSDTILTSMKNQPQLENPHLQSDDLEDFEDDSTLVPTNGTSEFNMSRNASSNDLRNANTHPGKLSLRGPPSRFHLAEHALQLSVNTSVPIGAPSPGDFAGNSYFSPTADSPSSTRSSSQAAVFPFPRQGTPNNHWDDNKHKTAPPISQPSSREGPGPLNAYQMNGRTVLRPSLPVMPANQASQAAQQLAMAQNRMRSASTPNIHDPLAVPGSGAGAKRYANGQVQPTVDNVPVPPIPSHMVPRRAPLNRSQTSSPTNGPPPPRGGTQSPMLPPDRAGQHATQPGHNHTSAHRQQPSQSDYRSHAPGGYGPAPITVLRSPPMPPPMTSEDQILYPSQLRVKIWFEPAPSHVTIVVPIVIKHRSLIDRIDSKMVKISSASISKGTARLKYKDNENDYVTIDNDDDVQDAIEDWGGVHERNLRAGILDDFELHWEEKQR
ncbi:MAG: hypothetical protein LQ352_007228 [Teloschistes flavicans]|nr:MAG: hypothetical protein LQ352_007228 [Teloschistes flavicans]